MAMLPSIHHFPHLSIIKKLATIFKKNNFSLYVVGGAVRDFLLGNEVHDIDLSTSASPQAIQKIFSKVIPTGIKHGTVTVLFHNHSFEITSFRVDGKYSNYRQPDSIQFTPSLEKDLARRDFTINAMVLDPLEEKIIDMYDGVKDLKNKIIRCVGNPQKRFQEDALRMLRAVRFSCKLNFIIEQDTKLAIHSYSHLISHISKERIWAEIYKTFLSHNIDKGIVALHTTNLFIHIFSFQLNTQELEYCTTLLRHSIQTTTIHMSNNLHILCLRIALCFIVHAIHKQEYTIILSSLKIPNKESSLIAYIIDHSYYTIYNGNKNTSITWTAFKLRSFLYFLGRDKALLILEYYKLCALAQHNDTELHYLTQYENSITTLQNTTISSLQQLAINGNDIMKIHPSIKGKYVGQLLNTALRHVLQYPHNNNKATLLQYLQETLQ